MARCRMIRPEFFTHGELYDAEAESGFPLRVAFAGLWCVADREGRFAWRPRELKLAVLPHDPVDFERVLMALVASGFIQCYEVAGERYGLVTTFSRHQKPHPRESPSRFPAPGSTEAVKRCDPGSAKAVPSRAESESDSTSKKESETESETEGMRLPSLRVLGPDGPDPATGTEARRAFIREGLKHLIRPASEQRVTPGVAHPDTVA